MSEFKNYFDSVDTKANTAAECGEIRSRAAKIKKRRKIASSGLGVTLAVMMTTTVAVSAVGGWDITQIIGRWFKGNTASVMDNLSEVTVLELGEDNFGALELTPRGAVADENVIILFMDVTRTDGGVFDHTEYEVTDKEGNVVYDKNGNAYKDVPWCYFNVSQADANVAWTAYAGDEVYHHKWDWDMEVRQYEVDDGNPYDNKMTMAFCFDKRRTKEIFGASKDNANITDIRLEDITLRIGNLKTKKETYELSEGSGVYEDKTVINSKDHEVENLPLMWNATLTFDTAPIDNITVKPNSNTTIKVTDTNGMNQYGRSFTVKNISASKISLSFDLEAPPYDFWNMPEYYDITSIIMKNGDVIDVTKEQEIVRGTRSLTRSGNYTELDGVRTDYEHFTLIFKDPIDPNDVAAVRIGDTTFPIE